MANFSFNVRKPNNLSAVLRQTGQKIRNSGGSFSGDETSGFFSGSGVEGRYSVGNNIFITITKKPLIAPQSMIISKITEYFEAS